MLSGRIVLKERKKGNCEYHGRVICLDWRVRLFPIYVFGFLKLWALPGGEPTFSDIPIAMEVGI